MAHRITSRVTYALALLGFATCATAANPFGSAVAGAPSLFVLAVVESRGNTGDATATPQEREPSREAQAQAADRARQAASQSSQRTREQGDTLADERKVTQR